MIERFDEEFGVQVKSPPICYNEELDKWVSVLYIGNTVYEMTLDGGSDTAVGRVFEVLVRPEGTNQVLVVGIDRRNTSLATEFTTEWVAAQAGINRDHELYASSIGLTTPIIRYDNSNIVIRSSRVRRVDLKNIVEVRNMLRDEGHDPDLHYIIAVVDLDPSNPDGGLAGFYIAWFMPARSGFVNVSTREWESIARALYHHEFGHAHGWQHHWPKDPDADDNLITCPALYGWTDTDSDGVIEILDPTPYGMP